MIDLPPDCQSALQAPVMQQIYHVESSLNPFAIGVVGGRLVRQPKNLEEAVATAQYLSGLGRNFSIGQGQVNLVHFERLGWDRDIRAGFDVCKNVVAAHDIFKKCHSRAISSGFKAKQEYSAVDAALSCYYSGKLSAGKTNPDVRRYIKDVLSTTPTGSVGGDSVSLAIPLVNASSGKGANSGQNSVLMQAAKKWGAGMLLSGSTQASHNASSMMLNYKEKD